MSKQQPGRKPAHLKPANGVTTGRDSIWLAIRKLVRFTTMDIENETRQPLSTIRTYVQGLERAGYLKKAGEKQTGTLPQQHRATIWELINDIGIETPRVTKDGKAVTQGRKRENMWRAIKILNDFDAIDLIVHASTESDPVSLSTAKEYIKFLHKAGYLVLRQKSQPGNKPGTGKKARYRFLPSKNTGPLPPMIQRVKHLYDPNLGEVVWSPAPEEGGDA